MNLNDLARQAHEISVNKGFWSMPRVPGEILMLIVTELAEAMEEIRDGKPLNALTFDDNGKPSGFPSEMADVLLRVLDACDAYEIDIERAVREKMAYNAKRPYLHGRTR